MSNLLINHMSLVLEGLTAKRSPSEYSIHMVAARKQIRSMLQDYDMSEDVSDRVRLALASSTMIDVITHMLTARGMVMIESLTTVAVGDSPATATRTLYPDLLKEVESLDRYDLYYWGVDEDDAGKYLKREDVLRILGGGA